MPQRQTSVWLTNRVNKKLTSVTLHQVLSQSFVRGKTKTMYTTPRCVPRPWILYWCPKSSNKSHHSYTYTSAKKQSIQNNTLHLFGLNSVNCWALIHTEFVLTVENVNHCLIHIPPLVICHPIVCVFDPKQKWLINLYHGTDVRGCMW